MILKLGMYHWGLKLYQVYINKDPVLTYFTARSNWVTFAFEWEKLLQLLAAKDYIDGIILLMKNIDLRGCLPLSWGCIHVYNHYFQTFSSLKPIVQSMPNFM